MKKTVHLLMIFLLLTGVKLYAQQESSGVIEGRVFNKANNQPVEFANLVIYGSNIGSVSDLDGKFIFTGIKPGYVRIVASSVGYEQYVTEEFLVTNANSPFIEIPMSESAVELDEIVVKASPFRKNEESPVSLRRIGIEQIEKNPGGNRDISKVIQSFPGVASTPAYRNDVIVRGGGPSENTFLLDGVEIPNLNHFATQGASGGPVGIINVDFIREVNFYSGAFPANTGNALSSVLDMRQIDGNKNKLKFRGSVGASDLALTLDGPLGENTTFIASARRSYLQFLFAALELPFLPTYNDFQFKTRTRINEKNEISFIGLGAIDQFKLNLDLKETGTASQQFILSTLPVNEQWNYTVGTVYKHFRDQGYDTWVLSRNYLNNVAYKYLDNDELLGKTYDFSSAEIENKFRYERNFSPASGYKIIGGVGVQYAKYLNDTYTQIYLNNELQNFNTSTYLDMFHYGMFGQVSKSYLNKRLTLSLGLRADGSSYSDAMQNPFKNLSPRFSSSFMLTEKLAWNFNTGRYQQRPAYTTLGFKDRQGNYVNRETGLKYIVADHLVSGFELQPNENTQLTVEGYFKRYSDYPFSIADSIPLASKGADYGVFGNEEVISISEGRAYGFEVLGRWQDLLGFNTILSYTYVRSEFKDERAAFKGEFIPTAWDNRHLLNLTATRTFKNDWYVGFKWRFVGGAPYTPIDTLYSSIRAAWDIQGGPYLDFSRYNQDRLGAFHQLDIRIDKQYYFKKWSINFYIDIQNIYNFSTEAAPNWVRASFFNSDPENPVNDVYVDDFGVERYNLIRLEDESGGTILPSVGIIVEF